MKLKLVKSGAWSVRAACDENGRCPLLTFFGDMKKHGDKDATAMVRLLAHVAERGPQQLGEDMSRPIRSAEGLFEFKRGKIRVFWFYDEDRVIVCTHGLVKKGQAIEKRDLKAAVKTRQRYMDAKRQKALRMEEK